LKSDFKTPVGGSYKLLLRDDAVPSIFNTTVKETPTKIYRSEFDKPSTSKLNINQQSNISTNVSNYSDTLEISTTVQDEPLCLTPKRQVCFKSAAEEAPLVITPSKCKITISPHKKTTPSKFELKNKIKIQSNTIKLLKQQIRRKDIKISTLAGLLKLLKDKQVLHTDSEELMLNKFGGLSQEIFSNIQKNQNINPKGRRYSKTIKEFSLTLNYYSPKAYEYARLV